MKTIKKNVVLTFVALISGVAFSQVNLGLRSTTQAATNAAISTNTVKPLVTSTAVTTRATVSTATTTTTGLKSQTSSSVQANAQKTTQTASELKSDMKNPVDANANAALHAQGSAHAAGQAHENAASGSVVNADIVSATDANLGVRVNGKDVIEKTDHGVVQTSAVAEKKAGTAAEATNKVKTKAEGRVNSDVKTAKQKADASVSGEIKSQTKVKTSGNH